MIVRIALHTEKC